jgi:hypothetical protein
MKNTLRFGIIGLIVFIIFSLTVCDDDIDNGGEETEEPGVISVIVTPKNYTVHRGHEQTFFVAVNNTSEKAVTWSIEGSGLHEDTVIDQSGKLSVSPDEEQTTLTIKATLAADTSKYGTAAVSIPAPTITGVEINLADGVVISPWYPASKAIDIDSGRTEQFLAKVVGQNFPKQDVKWTITGASSGTSITGGLLTVSSAEPQNKVFTVQAASTIDPDRVDIITVTVRPPTINTFRVVPSSTSIAVSSPVEFAVTVLGSGNVRGRYEIEWSVERSDGRPIMQPGTEVKYDNRDGTFTTWLSPGTRFEGNILYTTADEVQGIVEEDEDGVETVTVYEYTLDVTAELKPATPVGVAASVLTTYEISLEVEDTFSPSLIDF